MSAEFIHAVFGHVWSIFLVVLFFGGSIFVHELGHFLAARRRGVHVERFSIQQYVTVAAKAPSGWSGGR